MKKRLTVFLLFTFVLASAQLPKGFVYVKAIIPTLNVDLRYASKNNFIGKKISGYQDNQLILTKPAALALKRIEEELEDKNLCLKVYDGYRPQQAVNHFISWVHKPNDTINKQEYYPYIKKKNLFKKQYIATRSGHSRGSTVDLTIIDGRTGLVLDMGSPYDFFGDESGVYYKNISKHQKENRAILQTVMKKHGFRGYSKEWWHFTLNGEPFKNTYFNFEVK